MPIKNPIYKGIDNIIEQIINPRLTNIIAIGLSASFLFSTIHLFKKTSNIV